MKILKCCVTFRLVVFHLSPHDILRFTRTFLRVHENNFITSAQILKRVKVENCHSPQDAIRRGEEFFLFHYRLATNNVNCITGEFVAFPSTAKLLFKA